MSSMYAQPFDGSRSRRGGRRFLFWLGLVGLLCLCGIQAQAWNPNVIGGRCRQSGNACRSTVGNAGGQGACCDPQRSNVIQCNRDNTCQGGAPQKWFDKDLPVVWFFNDNNRPDGFKNRTESQYVAALKTATEAWSKPNCTSFKSRYGGKTTSTSNPRDNRLVIFFPTRAQFARTGGGGSTLAFSQPVSYTSGRERGRMIDADITFNPNYSWGTSPVRNGEIDVIAVAAHEFGHSIGFAHSPFRAALMYYANTGRGDAWRNTYGSKLPSDDVSAICATYPRKGPCTKDADCGGCLRCSGGQCVSKNIRPITNLCKPCKGPSDCGGSKDICVRLKEGNRCAQACDSTECCPTGYRCSDVGLGTKMCLPESGQCPAVRCSTDANCGAGESCQSGTCKPKPVPKHPKTCTTCKSSSDCGSGNVCASLSAGDQRCFQPCVNNNFCPTGYTCRSFQTQGFFCVPETLICSCKVGGGTYGDRCDDKCRCASGFQCFQTQGGGGFCAQPCGSGAAAAGQPGSACGSGGRCQLGARCYQIQGGQNICLTPCGQSQPCRQGGRCYRTQAGTFCLCQGVNECSSGQICSKPQIFGGQIGACAQKTAAPKCQAGFECKDAGGVKICQPGKVRDVGQSCGRLGDCKNGLRCLRVSSGTSEGVCFEDCTSSKSCKTGGRCIAQGNISICLCGPGATCASGLVCETIKGSNASLCKKGAPNKDCGNGTCGAGENCGNCPSDCACPTGFTCQGSRCQKSGSADCGNGTCGAGENCTTCPRDCACPAGYNCKANRCEKNANCGNNKCEANIGENCTTCPNDCGCPSGQSCNNGTCQSSPNCGNNKCDTAEGENCSTCASDCACPTGQQCRSGTCQSTCGNGTCERTEDCSLCAKDCKCGNGRVCQKGRCVVDTSSPDAGSSPDTDAKDTGGRRRPRLDCAPEDRVTTCDTRGRNCREECVEPQGCGCHSNGRAPYESFPFFMLLFGFLLTFAARRARR